MRCVTVLRPVAEGPPAGQGLDSVVVLYGEHFGGKVLSSNVRLEQQVLEAVIRRGRLYAQPKFLLQPLAYQSGHGTLS